MKMLPVQLSLNPPLGLWSDVLWRCPPAPPSQLAELKTQLPASLPSDPRLWCREDVSVFLRFCEREFDLPKVDYDLFQMNGKALCLLTRADFGHRCPGAGDVLHNVLQMLIIESHMMQWHLPNSPVTPTSRYPLSPHSHPPTPTWPPIAPSESPFHNAAASTAHNMHHFMAPNSVTLSPPPSVDSQASSPPQNNQEQQHQQQQQQQQHNGCNVSTNSISSSISNNSRNGSAVSVLNSSNSNSSSGSGSNNSNTNGNCHAFALGSSHNLATMKSTNNSDSEEDTASYSADTTAVGKNLAARAAAAAAAVAQYNASPPTTPILKDMPQLLSQQLQNSFVNSWSQSQQSLHQQQQQQQQQQQHQQQQQQKGQQSQHERKSPQLGSGSVSAPTTPSFMQPVKREFFPDNYKLPVKREFFPDSPEPNTNGRLLWDFLQQLLNDREQKYSDLIAWKCRDTGVFKIVDPAGLAKLWGIQKNHLSMNYDKMSRALRYYYRVNILRKVQGERHCYQFLRNPSELKNIKNISLLRQSLGNQQSTANNQQTSNNNNNNSATANQQQSQQQQQQSNNNNNTNNSNNNNNNNNNNSNNNNSSSSSHSNSSSSSNNNNNNNSNNNPPQSPNWVHHTPQRPASRMSLPALSQSAAAAAAVAAAAAAYGPSPTSPLFMHAINGAFHYLSSSAGGPPPNSPAALPSTPSDKFQFNAFKMEDVSTNNNNNNNNNNVAMQTAATAAEEMKPTDLSVGGGSEKRPYANEDCYPLIRNADGLTTIKLIRYNDNNNDGSGKSETAPISPKQLTTQDNKDENQITSTQPAPVPMDSENSIQHSGEVHYSNHAALMPTDLSKQMQHDDDYDR